MFSVRAHSGQRHATEPARDDRDQADRVAHATAHLQGVDRTEVLDANGNAVSTHTKS